MAATYTKITLDEMRAVLRAEKGWTLAQDASGKEYVFEWATKKMPGVVIRVCSSIAKRNGEGRGNGQDAIRTFAVQLEPGSRTVRRGYIKSRITKRTQGWRNNLKARVFDVLAEAQERWAQDNK